MFTKVTIVNMANEHTLVRQKTLPVPMTVADGTGIAKGALLKLSGDNTASLADTDEDVMAGVAATEKIASDGRTSVSVIQGPGDEFTATSSGTITRGDAIGVEGDTTNTVRSIATVANSAMIRLGYALNSTTNGQTVRYKMDIGQGLGA